MEEFNELISAPPSVENKLEQRQNMFLIVTLVGLLSDLDLVCNQILSSSIVPIVDNPFVRLLLLAALYMLSTLLVPPIDSSI